MHFGVLRRHKIGSGMEASWAAPNGDFYVAWTLLAAITPIPAWHAAKTWRCCDGGVKRVLSDPSPYAATWFDSGWRFAIRFGVRTIP